MDEALLEILNGKLAKGHDMNRMACLLSSPDATDSLRAAFLSSLYVRGETAEEIEGFASGIMSMASIKPYRKCTDIVGTGGDRKGTINVSTASAIVCASLGIKIGKHGNRSITGKFGSADFMEACGYDFSMNGEEIVRNIQNENFVFILAPEYNNSFMSFSSVRKKLGHRTIFNIMGPITNPLGPEKAVIGSTSPEMQGMIARVMKIRSVNGYSITSSDGMDEISPISESFLMEVFDSIKMHELEGRNIIGRRISEDNIEGKDRETIFNLTLSGIKGENRDASAFIALNAAPALLLNGVSGTFEDSYKIALKSMENGMAFSKLTRITKGKVLEADTVAG